MPVWSWFLLLLYHLKTRPTKFHCFPSSLFAACRRLYTVTLLVGWEIDGETVKTVSDFIFLGPKITADGDCSHEIKRRLLLGRKVMTNLDSIFKSRDITLPTKVRLVKAMVFPVVMYGCESWTVKKAERRRIDAFELWGLHTEHLTRSSKHKSRWQNMHVHVHIHH